MCGTGQPGHRVGLPLPSRGCHPDLYLQDTAQSGELMCSNQGICAWGGETVFRRGRMTDRILKFKFKLSSNLDLVVLFDPQPSPSPSPSFFPPATITTFREGGGVCLHLVRSQVVIPHQG